MTLVLLIAAWLGGAAATYLFDDDASLPARLAVGGPLGVAVFGLAGFVAASFFGLGAATVAVGVLAAAAPLLAFADPARRRRLRADAGRLLVRPRNADLIAMTFYMGMAAAVGQVMERAALFERGVIGTGVDHNVGDLPFHIAIVTGFVPPSEVESVMTSA